jgi:hypothetical protein
VRWPGAVLGLMGGVIGGIVSQLGQ